MLSNDSGNSSDNKPSDPQVSSSQAGAADSVPCLNPGDPIEVASTGGGTITDPSGKDTKPPAYESDSFLA
jgi:hypothetical protein